MDSKSYANAPVFITRGLTARRIVCMASETLFLVAGVIVGSFLIPSLTEAANESDLHLDPFVRSGIEWYWPLLAILGIHILLWPVVPRLLGWFGIVLWWALGIALPLAVVAVPAMFVLASYASIIRTTT